MIVVSVYTWNDYLESPVAIEVDTIAPNKESPFPAVSICMKKSEENNANTDRLENFIRTYYAEHNIEMPRQ